MNYKVNWWHKTWGYAIVEAGSVQEAKRKVQRKLDNGLNFNREDIQTDFKVTSVKLTKELI